MLSIFEWVTQGPYNKPLGIYWPKSELFLLELFKTMYFYFFSQCVYMQLHVARPKSIHTATYFPDFSNCVKYKNDHLCMSPQAYTVCSHGCSIDLTCRWTGLQTFCQYCWPIMCVCLYYWHSNVRDQYQWMPKHEACRQGSPPYWIDKSSRQSRLKRQVNVRWRSRLERTVYPSW